MEKPNPSNIRSYFKPIREASVSSRDVEKTEASSLASLSFVVSIILAAYALFSWSIIAAIFSGAAFALVILLPSKKTTVKETINVVEERHAQSLFDGKALWGIYDNNSITVFADFSEGCIYFAGPAVASTRLANHKFSIYNFQLRSSFLTKKQEIPLEVKSYPTFASGNAVVNGHVLPVTVQTGYKSYTSGGNSVITGHEMVFRLFSSRNVKDVSGEKSRSINTMICKDTGKVWQNEDEILKIETDEKGNIKNHTTLSATLTDDKFKEFCNKVEEICLKYSSNYAKCEFRDGLIRLKEK